MTANNKKLGQTTVGPLSHLPEIPVDLSEGKSLPSVLGKTDTRSNVLAEVTFDLQQKAADNTPPPLHWVPMAKLWCRVIDSLTPDTIDVVIVTGESCRISKTRVPPDLQVPNAEFWLSSDPRSGETVIFRHEEDRTPAI
jgi:hypothetical protein